MKNTFQFATFLLLISLIFSCTLSKEKSEGKLPAISNTSLVILGTVQDAGSPHIACSKDCCKPLFQKPDINRKVVSLGLIDSENNKSYIFEATPDFTEQVKVLKSYSNSNNEIPNGIFLTHAHIGHYTGLMYLGKEAMNAKEVQVYTMPKMKQYLENNGPWSQLVSNGNITIQESNHLQEIQLTSNIKVMPFLVPHRDEYSETAGYTIIGPNKSALFIPDIDKWGKWEVNIIDAISNVDYAFVDATFYDEKEINNRDISQIPHPFIIESMELFKNLDASEKSKVYFIHFNHTNPTLNAESKESKKVLSNGFNIARMNDIFEL
jgi:pyrroloquinoline quinone biosynthesis protein B